MPDDTIVVGLEVDGHTITFPYQYREWAGAVRVTYPDPMPHLPAMAPALGLGMATYLGQLCLAARIRTTFRVSDAMALAMAPVAEMLYDVRRWKDGLPIGEPPRYVCDARAGARRDPVQVPLEARRSALLFSGGKDSTLSALVLRGNGFEVDALHLSANRGVERFEDDAAAALASTLALRRHAVRYEHDDFVAFSTAHAARDAWNDFPRCNLVPFGRDLVTIILALPVAAHLGAAFVSLGHDHECRNSYFDYGGKSVPRNDVESTRGAAALESYARQFALAGVGLLPPVAALPELRILHEMLVGHPELMARAAFCFWGRNCGRCAKCLRYYLAQRLFGVDVLTFAVNPLSEGACPELDDILAADGVLFGRQVLYCLGRLAERYDIRPDETRLSQFRRTRLGEVLPLLDSWAVELLTVRDDPQLPAGYHYDLIPVDLPADRV